MSVNIFPLVVFDFGASRISIPYIRDFSSILLYLNSHSMCKYMTHLYSMYVAKARQKKTPTIIQCIA